MKGMLQNTINFINQNLGNNDVMVNFFKETIKNKKKIIVDGNEFETLYPNNISFDNNGSTECFMKINDKIVKCHISINSKKYGISFNIYNIHDSKECSVPLKIKNITNEETIDVSNFTLNSDFSVSFLTLDHKKNYKKANLPLKLLNCSLFKRPINIKNMNFYDFDKEKKIIAKSSSTSFYTNCNNFEFDNQNNNDSDIKVIKDLLTQIKTELKRVDKGFSISFTDKNIVCSTDEKIIFFKKDEKTNQYVKCKTVQKILKNTNPIFKDYVFIKNNRVYNINSTTGYLEIYSLREMECIQTIKLSDVLSKDNYVISKLDPENMSFMDKKTFEEQLKTYMVENCIVNTINNDEAKVNSVNPQQQKCDIF